MRFVAVLLIGCLLSSCATIVRGRNETISVESDPSGATATIKCAGNVSASGTTPARITIPRNSDGCSVQIEKSGSKTQTIAMDKGVNFSYWLNSIAVGGIPVGALLQFGGGYGSPDTTTAAVFIAVGLLGGAGFIIDRATGAMYDHNPNVIKVTLQPQQ